MLMYEVSYNSATESVEYTQNIDLQSVELIDGNEHFAEYLKDAQSVQLAW